MVQDEWGRFFLFKTSGILKIDPQKIILHRFEKYFRIFLRSGILDFENFSKSIFSTSKIEKSKQKFRFRIFLILKIFEFDGLKNPKFPISKIFGIFFKSMQNYFLWIDFQKSGRFEKEKSSPSILHHKLPCYIDENTGNIAIVQIYILLKI